MTELKRGYQGPLYDPWYDWAARKYSKLAPLLGRKDGYFGSDEERWVYALQANLGIVQDGVFGDRTAAAAGYTWPGAPHPPVVDGRRPIWLYSEPGSGAPGNAGPSFQLGERVKAVLKINHQWISSPIGGYLGFMGGDPKYSYVDVITMQDHELERLLWLNPDLLKALDARKANPTAHVDFETWFSAYSQSADGMRRSINRLFGDGGPFALLRDRINGLILFGDPGTPKTGISRLNYPDWLERLVVDINYPNDFYAVAPDKIRPAMFNIIVEANMSLPFFVHVLRLAIRIIPSWLGLLGFGALAGAGGLMSMANSNADQDVDDQLYNLLNPLGVLSDIPGLIQIISAIPGLQAHGGYEFDPVMMDRAFAAVAGFRR